MKCPLCESEIIKTDQPTKKGIIGTLVIEKCSNCSYQKSYVVREMK